MNTTDLNPLLKHWKAPPVPADFDQNVLRRIRQREPERAPSGWRTWFLSPIRLAAAAALLSVLLGGWAGQRSARVASPPFPFAGHETVTGSYLAMGSGGGR